MAIGRKAVDLGGLDRRGSNDYTSVPTALELTSAHAAVMTSVATQGKLVPAEWARRPPHGGVPVDVMCDIMGSDRIFETSKSGEFSGFELSVILFLWENEKKSGAQRPISIFFETWA